MSRPYILKLCYAMINARTPMSVFSQFHLKYSHLLNNAMCRRGYTRYTSQVPPRICYPLYRLVDKVFSDYPVKPSTTAKEEYRKYDNKYRRNYKHLGMLLSGLGFIVALCDAPNLAGRYLVIHIIMYVEKVYVTLM